MPKNSWRTNAQHAKRLASAYALVRRLNNRAKPFALFSWYTLMGRSGRALVFLSSIASIRGTCSHEHNQPPSALRRGYHDGRKTTGDQLVWSLRSAVGRSNRRMQPERRHLASVRPRTGSAFDSWGAERPSAVLNRREL